MPRPPKYTRGEVLAGLEAAPLTRALMRLRAAVKYGRTARLDADEAAGFDCWRLAGAVAAEVAGRGSGDKLELAEALAALEGDGGVLARAFVRVRNAGRSGHVVPPDRPARRPRSGKRGGAPTRGHALRLDADEAAALAASQAVERAALEELRGSLRSAAAGRLRRQREERERRERRKRRDDRRPPPGT